MNHQDIFDIVTVHLFKQGWRAQCNTNVYVVHPEGTKDPVGLFLEEVFDGLNSNRTIKWMVENWPEKFPEWMKQPETLGLLGSLQSVHDKEWNWETTDNMRNALSKVAEQFKLSSKVVSQLGFSEQRTKPIKQELTMEEEIELKSKDKKKQTTGAL